MFTGIVECTGRFRGYTKLRKGRALILDAGNLARRLKPGDSLAVNGACLTVAARQGRQLSFHILQETERCTNLGGLRPGDALNLERPLRYNGRIEGHFVLGHIDATGRVESAISKKEQRSYRIRFPRAFRPFVVPKGSVGVNGVSLTVGRVGRSDFWVHCVPFTLKRTNLGRLTPGEIVNLEADVLARFLRSL